MVDVGLPFCFSSVNWADPTRADRTGAAELASNSAQAPFSTALGFCFLSMWTPAVDQGPWIGLSLAF
ncbi:hypothetical protein CEP54_007424 [Fusarium duplospermum]|uniref:Uncharacterized protein n=1 Tax=Fusarium duplospermum TaxID=1325734 RepID=A0A428Q1K5_9HYPO|nr:hypothetical protein CEP54_007424 [Fusarium duplospermum]